MYTMSLLKKPSLSFADILKMNAGFFGIQYSFGLQQTAITPIYDFLKANPDQIPLLHMAGPLTGLIIQPIIGAMSDRTWSPTWGRRKPYFMIGALLCSVALFLFPFSSALWMAAGLLWILDIGNNTAMEPYRAFIADKLPTEQQATGFQAQSFFTGLGITLANLSLYFFPMMAVFKGNYGVLPKWVYASFFLGAVCSIATVWFSLKNVKETPPTEEELAEWKANPANIFTPFKEIWEAIVEMPKIMWQLALVYLFQWYALFCYWQNTSKSIALSLFNATPISDPEKYTEATGLAGLVNGWYNIVMFLTAFLLARLAKTYGAKWVHFVALLLAGLAFLTFPHMSNQTMLFVAISGFGIGWASMMGIPYLMVVNDIPPRRFGVYMGVINMMIVIPMLIQTLTFGPILKNFLGNDPRNAISFAGVLLLIAATLTLLLQPKKVDSSSSIPKNFGH
jgi:maltose/moltooligosaccharide transporter